MVETDRILDEKPTADNVKQLAELRIRNILCFRELQLFNAAGKWLNKHPLLSQYSYRNELLEMRRQYPDKFLKQYSKTDYNVSRYQSYLNRKNISDEDKEKWTNQLTKHQERLQIFLEVMRNG